MAVEVSRRRFTADEYQAMGRAGILRESDRVELIDGEVLAMSSIGPAAHRNAQPPYQTVYSACW